MLTDQDCRDFVAENIRRLLAARGWKPLTLANKLSGIVPQNTIYRIVRGESYGTAPMQVAIAEVLGVTVDYLLTDPAAHASRLPDEENLQESA